MSQRMPSLDDQIRCVQREIGMRDRYEWMALNGSWGDFWQSRKPRVRVAAAGVQQ